MNERTELMIGDFARRSRLPVSTLRYYDRIGLLTPAAVDPGSRYRRYTLDQLPVAVLVARLRSLGMAPSDIEHVLAGGSRSATALARERERIAAQVERGRERLRGLDRLIAEGPPEDYRAEIVRLAAREVPAVSFDLPVAELEGGVTRAIVALRSALRRGGHRRSGPWGATFPLDIADRVRGFVFAPVAGRPHDAVETARLPASGAVAVVHRGGPARLPLAYGAAFTAIDRLGLTAAGPVIEEYGDLDNAAASIQLRVPFREPSDGVP